MSTRIEWSSTDAEFSYTEQRGAFEDAYGSVNEGPALGIFTGSDGSVIEASSREAMVELLSSLIELVRSHSGETLETLDP